MACPAFELVGWGWRGLALGVERFFSSCVCVCVFCEPFSLVTGIYTLFYCATTCLCKKTKKKKKEVG